MKQFYMILLFVFVFCSEFSNSLPGKNKNKKSSSIGKKLKTAAIIGGSAFVGYKAAKFAGKLSSMNLGKYVF